MRFSYISNSTIAVPESGKGVNTAISYRGVEVDVTIREVANWRETKGNFSEFQIYYKSTEPSPLDLTASGQGICKFVKYDLDRRAYEKSLKVFFEEQTDRLIEQNYNKWMEGRQGQLF